MKKKTLLALLLVASISTNTFAFKLNQITITGVEEQEKKDILATFPFKLGSELQHEDITRLVRDFYQTGRYQNVDIRQSGNSLVVNLKNKPIIHNVSVKNFKTVANNAVRKNLETAGIKEGAVLDISNLDALIKEINNYYRSIGNTSGTASYKLKDLPQNKVDVLVTVDADVVMKVRNFKFIGAKSFKQSALERELVSTKKNTLLFWRGKFDKEAATNDVENIKALYTKHGYAQVKVTGPELDYVSNQKDLVDLSYYIDEGQVYKVTSVDVIGDLLDKASEIKQKLSFIKVGDTYNGVTVNQTVASITSILGNLGFVDAKINVANIPNEQDKTIDIKIIVEPGQRYYANKILFTGNTTTRDEVLRREIPQMEGVWLSQEMIDLGKLKLLQTGYFDTVEYEIVKDSKDLASVSYNVTERRTGSLQVGVGYSSDSGINYNAGIKQNNFLGSGYDVSLSADKSKHTTNVSFDVLIPKIFNSDFDMSNSVFFSLYESSKGANKAKNYRNLSYGYEGKFIFPIGYSISAYTGFAYNHHQIRNLTPEFMRTEYLSSINNKNTNKVSFTNNDFEFLAGIRYSSLNRGFFPTAGTAIGLNSRVTIPGSSNAYYQLSLNHNSYYPLTVSENFIVHLNSGVSFGQGFSNKRYPFYKFFSSGGIRSIRGFEYGNIGPKAIYDNDGNYQASLDTIGGDISTNASLSLIVPTPFVDSEKNTSFRTSVFFDIGNTWSTTWNKDKKKLGALGSDIAKQQIIKDSNDPKKYRSSYGVALQWSSPIGPLIFSYAIPVKKYPGDDVSRFQFSVDGTF